MEKNILNTLCDIINNKILSGKKLSDDQIMVYLKQIFEYVRHTDPTELPRSFYLLRQTMFKMWEYGDTKKFSPEVAFMYGAVWGGAMLSELAEKEIKEQPRLEAMAKQNLKYLNCFEAIYKHPGIKHKDLAAISSMTTSELSQWMARIQHEGYFSFSRVGREKYYYVEKKGEEILKEMERQQMCCSEATNNMNDSNAIRTVIRNHLKTSNQIMNNENVNVSISRELFNDYNKDFLSAFSKSTNKSFIEIGEEVPDKWELKEKYPKNQRMICSNY